MRTCHDAPMSIVARRVPKKSAHPARGWSRRACSADEDGQNQAQVKRIHAAAGRRPSTTVPSWLAGKTDPSSSSAPPCSFPPPATRPGADGAGGVNRQSRGESVRTVFVFVLFFELLAAGSHVPADGTNHLGLHWEVGAHAAHPIAGRATTTTTTH